jgi:hypothetical protein
MRKLANIEELLDLWLVKYHNTTMQNVKEEHPEWKNVEEEYKLKMDDKDVSSEEKTTIGENLGKASREFYETYAVTQEQHDEWEKEAKMLLRKKYKIPKWTVDRGWWSVYLNCSPSVIKEN